MAQMSHELRTPLNAVIGFSDVMLRELHGPLGNARYQEYAHHISESGGRLLEVLGGGAGRHRGDDGADGRPAGAAGASGCSAATLLRDAWRDGQLPTSGSRPSRAWRSPPARPATSCASGARRCRRWSICSARRWAHVRRPAARRGDRPAPTAAGAAWRSRCAWMGTGPLASPASEGRSARKGSDLFPCPARQPARHPRPPAARGAGREAHLQGRRGWRDLDRADRFPRPRVGASVGVMPGSGGLLAA